MIFLVNIVSKEYLAKLTIKWQYLISNVLFISYIRCVCVCVCVCGTNMNPNMLFLLETNKLIHNPYLFFFPNRNHTYRESKQQILLKIYKNGSNFLNASINQLLFDFYSKIIEWFNNCMFMGWGPCADF